MSADPVTALVLTGLTVAQQVSQGQAQAKAARAQARAYADEAARTRKEAAFQENELRRRNRQALGRQRALYAKSGVNLEGSPLLVQEDTATLGELDALTIRRAGDARAAQVAAAEAQARAKARAALTGSYFRAGETLLTGVQRAREDYPKFFPF